MLPVVISHPSPLCLTGVLPQAVGAGLAHLLATRGQRLCVLVTPDPRLADRWADDLEQFAGWAPGLGEVEWLSLPELPPDAESNSHLVEQECERLTVFTRLSELKAADADAAKPAAQGRRIVLVTTPDGFFRPAPSSADFEASEIRIAQGDTIDPRTIADKLGKSMGYEFEPVCEAPGQYSMRGGILDVYPLNARAPVRLDFFGDTLESLRTFDPATQRSIAGIPSLTIAAFSSATRKESPRAILGYLPASILWVFHEPGRLQERYPARFSFPERIPSAAPTFRDLIESRPQRDDAWTALSELDQMAPLFPDETPRRHCRFASLETWRPFIPEEAFGENRVEAELQARRQFLDQVVRWDDEGYEIALACRNEGDASRLREVLDALGLSRQLAARQRRGSAHQGFKFEREDGKDMPCGWLSAPGSRGLVLVTDNEIFGRMRVRPSLRRRRLGVHRTQVDQMLDFSELVDGDIVVHIQHGICRFRGIKPLVISRRREEVVVLEFEGGTLLNLPVHESHLLTRYVGLTKAPPKLAKLGSAAWNRTRREAEEAAMDLAADLLRVQALRQARRRPAYGPDNHWMKEFEASFPYEETRDQHQAIIDIKKDLEGEAPADRLLCGDVGFGKTEVAIRAAFKAVNAGHQVAILVPTTVLAQQHFNTFRERMGDYPVTVEMLSRFRTPKAQAAIISQLKAGRIDILVGTHRILSEDVVFPRLGLLVIDEEHRFGVRQKERIKRISDTVDVLSMSATPIPRSLHLALTGARALSVIETPPSNRLPIETIVKPYDFALVLRAVKAEIDRGGQVFYLHNHVSTIHIVARQLMEAMPGLRIAVGHGQMSEHALEKIMTRFVAGEFDILVCTTIIETGLDIPNCNTIIIEGADRFGLSQLYQLRGRVGRSPTQAYCYLFLRRHTTLLDKARDRLSAMRQHNQLGSGFRIATRDLELRGAGNLLGARQSGHIAGVGFDLYCELLRQSVARLKGDPGATRIRARVALDFVIMGEDASTETASASTSAATGYQAMKLADQPPVVTAEASIPSAYIPEISLRMDAHRRLALALSQNDVDELLLEFSDRFGPPPEQVQLLAEIHRIRCLAEDKSLAWVATEGNLLKVLKATGIKDDYIKSGSRFPRLDSTSPAGKLKEIRAFLKRL